MIRLSYMIFFGTLFLLLEILLRSWGMLLPLTAPFLFYTAIVMGWPLALSFALPAGLAVDFVFGYSFPWTFLCYGGAVILALFWFYKVDSDSILLHLIPGLLLTTCIFIPEFIKSGFRPDTVPAFLTAIMAGAFFLPALILLLDFLNVKLGFEPYTEIKSRRRAS